MYSVGPGLRMILASSMLSTHSDARGWSRMMLATRTIGALTKPSPRSAMTELPGISRLKVRIPSSLPVGVHGFSECFGARGRVASSGAFGATLVACAGGALDGDEVADAAAMAGLGGTISPFASARASRLTEAHIDAEITKCHALDAVTRVPFLTIEKT